MAKGYVNSSTTVAGATEVDALDYLYVVDQAKEDKAAGDRVLLKLSADEVTVNNRFNAVSDTVSQANISSPFFISTDKFVLPRGKGLAVFNCVNSEWVAAPAISLTNLNATIAGVVRNVPGYEAGFFISGTSDGSGFLVDWSGNVICRCLYFSPIKYDAEQKLFYCMGVTSTSAYRGNIYSTTLPSEVGTKIASTGLYVTNAAGANGDKFACTEGSRIIVYSVNYQAKTLKAIYQIACTDYLVNVTGLEVGDYIFMQYNGSNAYWAGTSAIQGNSETYPAYLSLYQITEDGLIKVSDMNHILARYFNESCLINYDERTKLLCIGTATDVRVFEWFSDTKEFGEISLTIPEYPAKADGYDVYMYQAAICPQRNKMAIAVRYYGTAGVSFSVVFYDITRYGSRVWVAYKNSIADFSNEAIQGVVTGNTDSDGKIEVKTVLPEILKMTIDVEPEPDTFTFTGAV